MSHSYDVFVASPNSSSVGAHAHHYTTSLGNNAHMLEQSPANAPEKFGTYSSLKKITPTVDEMLTIDERLITPDQHSIELSLMASSTSQILVQSIVQRLVKRLPSNSGERLSSLEEEELVRSSVANLVNHSEYQLVIVVKELLQVLENLNKQLSQANVDDSIQVKVMQSQLFILQVLVACLIHFWKQSLKQEQQRTDGVSKENTNNNMPREWADPPPLNDNLAKQILEIMILYLKLTVSREDLVYAAIIEANSKMDKGVDKFKNTGRKDELDREADVTATTIEATPLAAFSVINGMGLFVLHPTFPPLRSPFDLDGDGDNNGDEVTPKFNTTASQSVTSSTMNPSKDVDAGNSSLLIQRIYRQASQVIFFLSSSNWLVVFARIKNRLIHMSTSTEEFPPTIELHLLECSNFVRSRLGSIIQELSSSFLHLKRNAQYAIALIIRRSIRAWIQYHPTEYSQLLASNRRLEGGPDLLFDHAYTLADSSRKKNTYWPMMTSLLLLCPDVMSKLAIGEGRKSASLKKKIDFLEMLHKGLRSSKLSDVAALCCVDICSAATVSIKSDSGLRLLVPDLESDLKEKLFDPKKASINGPSHVIEVPLMVATFVAFFRLDPEKTLREMVPVLMNDFNPIAYKIALVKSCIQLTSERQRLSWYPDVKLLSAPISSHLRIIFKELVYKLSNLGTSSLKMITYSSKPCKLQGDDAASRQELLQAILQLWHIDIESAAKELRFDQSEFFSSTLSENVNDVFNDEEIMFEKAMAEDSILALMHVMTRAAYTTSNWQIHIWASDLLHSCVALCNNQDKFIHLQAREAMISCSSHLTLQVANLLIISTSTIEQQHLLTMLSTILKKRSDILELMEEEANHQVYSANQIEKNQERQSIKVAMLLMICSANAETCSLALQACKEAARLRKKLHLSPFQQADYTEWTRLYERLGEIETLQTGRIAQQKRIRACLREVTTCTAPLFAAWKEAYRRWQALTLIVAKPIDNESSETATEKAGQWHNFAGCLSAIGGACIVERSPILEMPPNNHSKIKDGIWLEDLNQQESPLEYVENYIHAMVDLLVSDSVWVREKAKETLGADMNSRLNGILFFMIHSVLSDFFDKVTGQPKPTEMFTIFVEQSIIVMQMVLSRMTTDTTIETTSQVDIGALMVLFAEYLNSITKRDQAARIRASMCQLCEQLMEKKSFFTFNNELRVRNRLFHVLAGWTSDSIEGTSSTEKIDRLQRDLDVICLRTISILLDKLPLLLSEDSPILDDSVDLAKSRQFSACFNYFIKVLNRAKTLEEIINPMPPSASGLSLDRLRESQTLKDLVPLKQSAILALSNLLASNIATGLHHSLSLAYQEDLQLRTAFMQIMTNVLNQGAAFEDLERLNASQKQSKLIDLISESDLQLALSICNVCRGYDVDAIDYILLNIFDCRGGILKFLKAALDEEIEATSAEEMVFRSNLFRVHLLSLYGRTHGYDYLRSIMAPLVTEMANKPKGYSFEIDPQRLEPGESATVNQHRLEEMAQLFVDQICNSAHRVPAVLREICRHIRQLMDRKFPSSRYQGVGGYIFLRFINPAVVAPQTIDINITSGKELRRGLLLISKILQTLASNTLFPQHKEPYMTGLNEFLKRNVWKVTTFLDRVSDTRTDPERIIAADQPFGFGISPFGYGIDNEDQAVLHRFFFDNIDKVGKELLSRSSIDSNGSIKSSSTTSTKMKLNEGLYHNADGKKIYEQLCTVLAEMGDPSRSEEHFSSTHPDANRQALQDFLRRQNGRNLDNKVHQQIFRLGPTSKSGRLVFYFTKWAQDAQTLDYEGLICHILQVLKPGMTQPYDIVFDLTSVQPNNMTPPQWLSYFIDLLPIEYAQNVRNVFFFNTNTSIRLQTRPWLTNVERSNSNSAPPSKNQILQQLQVNANVIYCTSMGDLEAYIERRNIALDSQTLSLYALPEEARFSQITMVWYYRALLPVTFKLTENHLQIISSKSQVIMQGSSGYLNEVFHLADIDDVRSISVRGDDNTFFVTCRGGSMSFLFISKDRSEIVSCLRQAKARVSRFESNINRSMDRSLLPSDVPGTLLNMAMLNITSQDHQLRLSAYDLLCALSTSFSFGASNARKRLLSTKGLALSANTFSLVADLSREFAQAASGVTLEFLSSFFEGFERATPGQKTACLQYMVPWIPNLLSFLHAPREEQREYQKKIKEILSHLITMTAQHPDLYSTMQRTVWSQFGSKLDELIPLLLDVFCEAAMDSGLHTERFDYILDTMSSFTSINLRGKLLAKLRRVIAKTAQNPTVDQLPENAAWKEIATLIRMNMALSFTSRMESTLYLPELLHVILLLAGNGVDATRYAIHASAVNFIHSLATGDISSDTKQVLNLKGAVTGDADNWEDSTNQLSQERLAKLHILLNKLSSPESMALFGLSTSTATILTSAYDASSTIVRESPNNNQIGMLATMMYQIVDIAAPTIDTSNAWRARLTSLVTSTAFQYNPLIQSRAFILLGCLAELTGSMLQGHQIQGIDDDNDEFDNEVTIFEVDDDLLYQILVSLRGSIQEWATFSNDAPIISIITCLSKMICILPDKSRYLVQMFWLGVSIVQYGHIPLFKSGIDLINATITSISQRQLAEKNGTDLISYLSEGRFEFREEAIRLDDETGVDFETNFSFALAALVVKGLRHPLTRESTIELLRIMLKYSALDAQNHSRSRNGQISTMQLGFFVALLPSATKIEDFAELLILAGVGNDHLGHFQGINGTVLLRDRTGVGDRGLYSYLESLENKEALLVITLLASLLQHSTVSDVEKQQLYRLLADSSRQFPAIVSILYEYLLPSIKEVYLNCQNDDILRSVDVITKVAISESIFQLQFQETKKRGGAEAYLIESGFACLLDCGTFIKLKDSRRVALAKLSTDLLSGLIDAGTA